MLAEGSLTGFPPTLGTPSEPRHVIRDPPLVTGTLIDQREHPMTAFLFP